MTTGWIKHFQSLLVEYMNVCVFIILGVCSCTLLCCISSTAVSHSCKSKSKKSFRVTAPEKMLLYWCKFFVYNIPTCMCFGLQKSSASVPYLVSYSLPVSLVLPHSKPLYPLHMLSTACFWCASTSEDTV